MTDDIQKALVHGEEARIETAQKYHVVQLAHYYNLSEKPTDSLFSRDLKQVFCLELIDKGNEKNKKHCIVGKTVARSLLKLTNQTPLPLFNPFAENKKTRQSPSRSESLPDKTTTKNRTPLNEELYQALNIVLSYYDLRGTEGLFASLLEEVQGKFAPYDLHDYKIQNFDKALRKFGRTLDEIVDELKKRYPGFRDFSFPLLEAKFRQNSTPNKLS